jgi:hypothetical protein
MYKDVVFKMVMPMVGLSAVILSQSLPRGALFGGRWTLSKKNERPRGWAEPTQKVHTHRRCFLLFLPVVFVVFSGVSQQVSKWSSKTPLNTCLQKSIIKNFYKTNEKKIVFFVIVFLRFWMFLCTRSSKTPKTYLSKKTQEISQKNTHVGLFFPPAPLGFVQTAHRRGRRAGSRGPGACLLLTGYWRTEHRAQSTSRGTSSASRGEAAHLVLGLRSEGPLALFKSCIPGYPKQISHPLLLHGRPAASLFDDDSASDGGGGHCVKGPADSGGSDIFCGVFKLPLPRNAQKRD